MTRVPAAPARERHGAELPGAEIPGAEIPGAEIPGAWWPGTDVPGRPAAAPGVTVGLQDDGLQVVLSGDVDLALAAGLSTALEAVRGSLAGGPRRAHLDVRAVTALDGTGLRFVEEVRAQCARAGVPCSTSHAQPAVRRVLELVRALPDGQLTAS